MTDDYETTHSGDREAIARYLHSLAETVADGEPLPGSDGADPEALAPSAPVGLTVKSHVGSERTVVRLDIAWEPADGQSSEVEEPSEERDRGSTRRGADTGGDADGGEMAAPADDLPDPSVGTRNAERAANEFERAVSFARKGKTRAADSRFQHAVRADPADPEIRRRFANFLWNADEPDRALAQFRQALEISPDEAALRVDLANFYWSQGESEAAVEQFERALELEPDNPDVHSTYGRFRWEERDDVEGAVEHLREALEIDDEHALAHLNYAILLRHGGREEQAAKHYDQAIELGEGNATVHQEYGHYLWATGDVEEAAKHYATAEELGGG